MEKVSVVIPIYNSENNLERCINSIINQSYSNLEIILVNDGSTDKSLEICKQFSNSDNRVKIINKKNAGVSAARNSGIEFATGEFITFLDSDDFVDKNMYRDMVAAQRLSGAEMIECGYNLFFDDKPSIEVKYRHKNEFIKVKYLIDLIEMKNTAPAVWNKLYKADILKNIRFSDLKYSEDLLFNIHVALSISMKYTLENVYHYYYQNDEGAKRSSFSVKKLDDLIARENIIEVLSAEKEDYSTVIHALHKQILIRVVMLYINLEKTSNIEKNPFREYLDSIFFKYSNYVNRSDIAKIRPIKYRYLIQLYRRYPKAFKNFISISMKLKK